MINRKYKCPCCGYFTFEEKPDNTFDICPVCFWEDDGVQLSKPDYAGGANHVSLNRARKNFKAFGASEERLVQYVRNPNEDELSGVDWEKISKEIEAGIKLAKNREERILQCPNCGSRSFMRIKRKA